ncbi:aspartic endopeptidase Pep1/aspergillopepsin F [Macrophomina phaseolina]|uniref:Aspartic endopeptidase Pep1/aspergillopepsin F n=1 Tax=Macrophomina phaseolina TaxID=35725 RepID=A0ABQ8GM13_9PEZI|nr:aspartic endopeptidase Pep1/aspergillopepsin F [Macrophomina phaseolina]
MLSVSRGTPVERAPRGFSLTQEAHGQRLRNGPLALGRIYNKYKGQMPQAARSAYDVAFSRVMPSAARSGSVVASPVNIYDTAYMIPVTVGKNTIYVDLDTGSSDFWAFSIMQPTSDTVNHNIYWPDNRTMLVDSSWAITYLDGSGAAGLVYNDTVSLGGMNFPNLTVGAATTASTSFVSAAYDGLLGLAFDVLNTVKPVKQKTLFTQIISSLPTALFTSNLKRNAPGTYNFGYIDATQYNGTITYTNVDTSNGWWQFNTTGYGIGIQAPIARSYSGVADTGTTLMILPSDIVTAYYAQISGATYSGMYGAWIYPCNSPMPNLNLMFGNTRATVPGSMMTYGPIDYVGNCYGGLQQNDGLGIAIYGDIFIKSQFIVYDRSKNPPRLGFAPQSGVNYS